MKTTPSHTGQACARNGDIGTLEHIQGLIDHMTEQRCREVLGVDAELLSPHQVLELRDRSILHVSHVVQCMQKVMLRPEFSESEHAEFLFTTFLEQRLTESEIQREARGDPAPRSGILAFRMIILRALVMEVQRQSVLYCPLPGCRTCMGS